MGTKNDKVILSLKKEIEAKKKLLASTSKFSPITNCSLEIAGVRTNLHAADKKQLLLLIAQVNSLCLALADVLPEEDLTICGYSAKDWLQDLIAKFNNLNIALEKDRLARLEAKLHNLLSTDTKVELEIEDLKSQI